MSLLTTERLFAGHEQADCAGLTADGVFYRCYVWLSKVTWSVEAACFRVQENGTEVEVFRNVIASATSGEVTATNGVPLDCPKILAVGTTFVVHWMQATTITVNNRNWQLYRATMAMEAFAASWTSRGAVAIYEPFGLYDAANVIGSDTDFVVVRCTDSDDIAVARYDGFDWVDTVWALSSTSDELIAPKVLGVYAHDDDNDLIITYQRADSADAGLYSRHYDADDGSNETSEIQTFTAFPNTQGDDFTEWVQVGHCRVSANRVAVVGEAIAALVISEANSVPEGEWVHHVVYRQINSATAGRTGNEHWAANFSMHSRPWSYASGTSITTPRLDVYVMLTFRSVMLAEEWSQAYAFACNLDFSQWQEVSSGAGLRPRPIVTIQGNSIGIPDARASGWKPNEGPFGAPHHQGGPSKRMNHLASPSAAPPFGPDVKTRTIPLVFFNSIRDTSDLDDLDGSGGAPDDLVTNTVVEGAGVRGIVVYMEDPWTIYRDATDPEQPVENFSAFYARTMHQCVPWGRGLFIAGGTPQLYDGSQMVEAGFLWAPEIMHWGTTTGGDMETNGTRWYYALYSWVDKLGHKHSRAGLPVQVPFGTDTAANIGVRTMTGSLKDATAFYPQAQSITIELYRTADQANDTNYPQFYRCYAKTDTGGVVDQRVRDTPTNDPTALRGYQIVVDGVSDAELVLQGIGPYQFDADLVFVEPIPQTIPACHSPALHQNRVFAADSLDPTRLVYSDENDPEPGAATYQAPVFGSNQWIRTGEIHDTTGLQSRDSVLVQFTRGPLNAIAVQDAGFGALTWSTQTLHESLGCVDPKSVVLYPLGIGFQALKGYYTLAPSGEAIYGVLARSRDQPQSTSGAAIEDDLREAGNIRAASHDPSRNRISLVCNGRPLVTQTWDFTLAVAGSTAGVWSITGLSETVSVTIVGAAVAVGTIADTLAAAVQALIDADVPDPTLRFEVASVTSPANVVRLVLVGDVDLTLAGTAPGTCTNTATVTEALVARPWVLDYYYDFQQWTRAELLPGSTENSRLAEAMDGCYWQGDGGARHVVLVQGAALIQRLSTDDNAYADQTASGLVGIPISLTWSWLHLAGLAGCVALDELCIQCERFADDGVTATLEYDIDGSFTGQQIPVTTYTWPRTGETVTPSDLRVLPAVRKARAHRLTIAESSNVATERTMAVTGLTAVVGVLPKTRRVADVARGET